MLELLVVLAILALLAGLAIVNIMNVEKNARIAATDIMVRQTFKSPLFTYRMAMSDFPSTTDGLQALVVRPAGNASRWSGPYLEGGKVPLDPWGQPYHYQSPGAHNKESYDLWSSGPDKQSGTEDDIGNW
jgi:general secretion pathway protein G